jgi:hypothetical protein
MWMFSYIALFLNLLKHNYDDINNSISSVGIATGYGQDDQGAGVGVPVGSRIFTFPYRPDRLWGPPNLL